MAVTSYPFDSQTTTENQYSRFFREIKSTGVVGDVASNALQVTATGSGMGLAIAPGAAAVRGHYVSSDAIASKTLGVGVSLARVDVVVLRLDPTLNQITIEVVAGTPGSGVPALTQTSDLIYEFPLAQIAVGVSVTTISNGNITDLRFFGGDEVGIWTTALRPAAPRTGRTGYNLTLQAFEYWTGSAWANVLTAFSDSAELDFSYTGGLTNAVAASVVAGSIANSKLADMNQATIKGRASGAGAGVPSDLSASQVKTLLAINSGDLSDFTEAAQDAVGSLVADSAELDFSYNDAGNSFSGALVTGSVANSKLNDMAASTIKGRASGVGTGVPTDLTPAQVKTALAITSSDITDTLPNSKLADMAASTIKGRASGAGSGVPTDLSNTQVKTILAIASSDLVDTVPNSKLADMTQGTMKGRAAGAGTGPPVDLTAAQIITLSGAAQLVETVTAISNSGSAVTVPDVTSATIHRYTLTANCTLTFPTAAAGKSFLLELKQDATGSRLATWPSSVKWPGATAPTLTLGAARSDLFAFACSNGSEWIAAVAGLNYLLA